jgi:hypothetical protein
VQDLGRFGGQRGPAGLGPFVVEGEAGGAEGVEVSARVVGAGDDEALVIPGRATLQP